MKTKNNVNPKVAFIAMIVATFVFGMMCYESGIEKGREMTDQYINGNKVTVQNVERCGDFFIYKIADHVYISDNENKYQIGDTVKLTK